MSRLQEYVEEKSVQFVVQMTKLSAKLLIKGIKLFSDDLEKQIQRKKMQRPTGKQTVKQLIGQNQGVSSIDIGSAGLKDFDRIAKKYGVDYAIVKDKTADPPKFMAFFKARDADALTQVVAEYTAKQMKKKSQEKPSVLKALQKFKEIAAAIPGREHEKRKEQER